MTSVRVAGAGGLVGPGLLLERQEAEGGRHLCGAGAGGTGAQDCGGLGQTARGGKVLHPVLIVHLFPQHLVHLTMLLPPALLPQVHGLCRGQYSLRRGDRASGW